MRLSEQELERRHALARDLLTEHDLDALGVAGNSVVIQPNPIAPDERMGLRLGACIVFRDAGAESLHSLPFEPLVAS